MFSLLGIKAKPKICALMLLLSSTPAGFFILIVTFLASPYAF